MNELDKSDFLVRKVLRESGLEAPSKNFTEKVKGQIIAYQSQKSRNTYQPLITKKGWIGMALCIVAIYAVAVTQTKSFIWLKSVWANLSNLSEQGISLLSQVGLSGFFIDVLVYFLLVSLVVIAFLKYNLNRRLQLEGVA